VVNGPLADDSPAFYKTVGMGWQDLVVTDVAYRRITQG
jgi:ornithine cyclodeaminase/alanine dehydrogenase-like protein (mu-crystallin family)